VEIGLVLQDIRSVSRKLREIEKTAKWVNQEEVQLKYPVTSFTEINEITNSIEPYVRLYTTGKVFDYWIR
jgi:hypothetical protein